MRRRGGGKGEGRGGEGDGWEERGGGEEGEGYRAGDQRGMQSLIPIIYTGEKEQNYSLKKYIKKYIYCQLSNVAFKSNTFLFTYEDGSVFYLILTLPNMFSRTVE